MRTAVRRHSWWVWVVIIVMGWSLLAFAVPKIQHLDWSPSRPAASGR